MKNIVPKKLSTAKFRFWRTITISDLIIISTCITLEMMFIFGLQWKLWLKLVATLIMILISLPLMCKNHKTHLRGWQLIYYQLNFLFSCKKYSGEKTRLLVPFHEIVSENYLINHGKITKTLIGAIQIKGFDITLLSSEEQILRLRDFQDALKLINFPITILKLELPLNFDESIKYQQKQLKILKNEAKNLKITKEKYHKINEQSKNLITFLHNNDKINSDNIKTEANFFVFVYGKNIQNINEKLHFLVEKLRKTRLNCQILTNYEITKILKLIWNPYQIPVTNATFKQHQTDLAPLLKFQELKFKSHYFVADKLFYSFNTIQDYPLFVNDLWGACLFANEQTIIWNIAPLNYEETKKNH